MIIFSMFCFAVLLFIWMVTHSNKLDTLSNKLDTLEAAFQLISDEDIIKKVLEKINTDLTCPQCKNILRNEAKHCQTCGYKLAGDTNKIPARLLDLVDETGGDYRLEWECLACNKYQDWEIESGDFNRGNKFIFYLKCNHCGKHAADILVDTENISDGISCVEIAPYGTLCGSRIKTEPPTLQSALIKSLQNPPVMFHSSVTTTPVALDEKTDE